MDTEVLGRSRFLNHYFEIFGSLMNARSCERLCRVVPPPRYRLRGSDQKCARF